MKRYGKLTEQIAAPQNLYLAFWKAARGKQFAPEMQQFRQNLERNIEKLSEQISSGTIETGNYTFFTIRDPKVRTICAASFPERVLHHAIMNICHPIFERKFIYHTYATRPKKGTYKAIDAAKVYTKKYEWFAKMDIRKYFDSISHSMLKQTLANCFKDPHLLQIFNQIIAGYSVTQGKGIPIGNLTSQYFANFYLNPLDHFIKENLALDYVRYMDDMLIFANSKQEITELAETIRNYINRHLNLELKPVIINKTENGISFLGYKIFPDYLWLNKASKRRFKIKYKQYCGKLNRGVWSQKKFSAHILPLFAFLHKADTEKLRKKLILQFEG